MGEEWRDDGDPRGVPGGGRGRPPQLFERLADHDESLMEKFVHEEEPTIEELRRAIRRATLANEGVPVLCGSAFKNKGVQPLLDAIIWYLPSPLDVPPMVAHDLKGEEVTQGEPATTSRSRRSRSRSCPTPTSVG